MICSKAYGKYKESSAEEIAFFARRLRIEDIPHDILDMFWGCRLVPLMKEDDGVRPVGIGENFR